MNFKTVDNPIKPMIPFNHMVYASVSMIGKSLKVSIDYEKGNHYTFKK